MIALSWIKRDRNSHQLQYGGVKEFMGMFSINLPQNLKERALTNTAIQQLFPWPHSVQPLLRHKGFAPRNISLLPEINSG